MALKLFVNCSCGGNLIVLSDQRPLEREGFYENLQMFFHEGKNNCEENRICEKLYLAKEHHYYFEVMQNHIMNKENKTKKEKVGK